MLQRRSGPTVGYASVEASLPYLPLRRVPSPPPREASKPKNFACLRRPRSLIRSSTLQSTNPSVPPPLLVGAARTGPRVTAARRPRSPWGRGTGPLSSPSCALPGSPQPSLSSPPRSRSPRPRGGASSTTCSPPSPPAGRLPDPHPPPRRPRG
jgi:hypothetical protein